MNDEKTVEEWLDAINKNHNVLLDVPKNLWTHDLCLAAVKRDYAAIHYMTEEYLTKEICLAAHQQSPSAIRYVPKDLLEQYKNYLSELI
jgi:hypothetical protein